MITPVRVVFMGTPAFAVPALEALHDDPGIELLSVVTQPDRPAGRGQKLTPPPVKTRAEELGLPVDQTQSIKKDEALQARLRELAPDFFVTVAFGQILTQAVLDIPKSGTINAHASLLPEFRGANPIQQAILQGKPETGVTTMLTELGVDTGAMLLKATVGIGEEETMGELTTRLSQLSGPLLVKTLLGLQAGTITPEPQDNATATHAPKCAKEDAVLDWCEPAVVLQRKVRAFNPAPGAVAFWGDQRMKIHNARVFEGAGNSEEILKTGAPGEILGMIEAGVVVQAGEGQLLMTTLQPAGKKPMAATDWARNALKSGPDRLTAEPVPQPV